MSPRIGQLATEGTLVGRADKAEKTTILIAEEDALLAELLTQALQAEADFVVAGTVHHPDSVLDEVARLAPRVLVLDVKLSGPAALALIAEVRGLDPPPQVLVLSGDESLEMQLEAARHGADGFLPKSQGVSSLAAAIRAVRAGEVWFTRNIVGQVLREHAVLLRRFREQQQPASLLSAREMRVLQWVARGRTNAQIAEELGTSVSTVKVHVRGILQKLDLPNRTEAAVFALREGLADGA